MFSMIVLCFVNGMLAFGKKILWHSLFIKKTKSPERKLSFSASIVSKKAAENLKALILDVKIGSGAFMETIEKGRILAQAMVSSLCDKITKK